MKVESLIRMLMALDMNAEIFMSHDGEGNSFSNPGDVSTECGEEPNDGKFYILYPDDSYYEYEELP